MLRPKVLDARNHGWGWRPRNRRSHLSNARSRLTHWGRCGGWPLDVHAINDSGFAGGNDHPRICRALDRSRGRSRWRLHPARWRRLRTARRSRVGTLWKGSTALCGAVRFRPRSVTQCRLAGRRRGNLRGKRARRRRRNAGSNRTRWRHRRSRPNRHRPLRSATGATRWRRRE